VGGIDGCSAVVSMVIAPCPHPPQLYEMVRTARNAHVFLGFDLCQHSGCKKRLNYKKTHFCHKHRWAAGHVFVTCIAQ